MPATTGSRRLEIVMRTTRTRRRLWIAPLTCFTLIASLLTSDIAQLDPALAAARPASSSEKTPTTRALALTQAANSGRPVRIGTETTPTSDTWANPDGTFTV